MALLIDRIDHVVLNCRDVDATAAWYESVLGMRREIFGNGRLALLFGNQKLNLRPSGAANWETGAVDAPGSEDLCFIADATADEIGAHLTSCGVTITDGPRQQDRRARTDDVALLPRPRRQLDRDCQLPLRIRRASRQRD